MSTRIKFISFYIALFSVVYLFNYLYDTHLNYNFEEISKEKVYKSGVIPPNKIVEYVQRYKIRSIIDLRMPGTKDLRLNPEKVDEIALEKEAVSKIAGLNYFNIPSDQVPSRNSIDTFLSIMNDQKNYPVLIHCYHGTGRAVLYSAIYKIEYENFTNEQARLDTRELVIFSSFDHRTPKGEFLKSYVSRKNSLVRN
jgi:protein tyrosine/serine phosphatase